MKALVCFIVMFVPAIVFSQGLKMPQVIVKTFNGESINAAELVQEKPSTIVYFFNNTSSEVIENLQYLELLANSNSCERQIKVVSIFYPEDGSYTNLKAVLEGSGIELETYIDVNGDLQRSMGLPVNSPALVSNLAMNSSGIVTGAEACTYELAVLDATYGESEELEYPGRSNEWARNSYINK